MYSLPKRERLHLKRHIDELFAHGKGFVAYPLRCLYLLRHEAEGEQDARASMMVSVGKKHFKRANKRNRVKRLVREAYRLNKSVWLQWLETEGKRGRIAFMFVGKELPEYHDIERAVRKAFEKLKAQQMATNNPPNPIPNDKL